MKVTSDNSLDVSFLVTTLCRWPPCSEFALPLPCNGSETSGRFGKPRPSRSRSALPRSPFSPDFQPEQLQHQRQPCLPSSAASSLSSSSTSPGKTRLRQSLPTTTGSNRLPQAAAHAAVGGSAQQTPTTSRQQKNSAQNQHFCWQQQQNQGRRRHSSPPSTNSEAASSCGPAGLLVPSVGGCTLASLAVGRSGQGNVNGTDKGHSSDRACNEEGWGGGVSGGGGSGTRISLLPRRRGSVGSGSDNGRISQTHQPQKSSLFASRAGGGRGRGFDAAPYQTTVLFRDR